LPGLVHNNNLRDAGHNAGERETNVSVNYLEQLYTFGDERNVIQEIVYFSNLFCFGLIRLKFKIKADSDEKVQWFAVDEIPKLAFDHNEMIDNI
jgi:8-oxo-dGTP diphosphatase